MQNEVIQGILIGSIIFLPGFFMSLLLFDWSSIDIIERVAFSIGLSLLLVTLGVFLLNLIGISITMPIVLIVSACIIFVAVIIRLVKLWGSK